MPTISLNIKCSNEQKLSVSIDTSSTVQQLKSEIAKHLTDTPAEQQRLIYSGKVLKDNEVLETYKMAEGHTIHLVRSQASRAAPSSTPSATAESTPSSNPTASTTPSAANPFGMPGMDPFGMGLGGAGGFPGMGGMGGMGMGGMPNMDPNMMNSMMSNPMFMAQMQQMLSNPQFMDTLIASNPMLAGMNTPEMRSMMQSMLSNPEMLRSMMSMAGGMGGMGGMGGLGAMGGMGAGATGAPPSTGATPRTNPTAGSTPANPFAALTGGAGATGGMPPFNPFTMDPATMQMLMGGMGAPTNQSDTRPPEERFATQLQQLVDMGFFDPERNLRALQLTGGNVNAAIEWLLSNP